MSDNNNTSSGTSVRDRDPLVIALLSILFTGLFGAVGGSYAMLHMELGEVRSELRTELVGVRSELRTELGGVRSELHAEISAVRAESHTDIEKIRTDLIAMQTTLNQILINTKKSK